MSAKYDQIEDALEHLHDTEYLGRHALASNDAVLRPLAHGDTPDSSHARGAAMNKLLRDMIAQVRREQPQAVKRARCYGDLLHFCYIDREKNALVAQRLEWKVRSFYRHRKKAILLVTEKLNALEPDAPTTLPS